MGPLNSDTRCNASIPHISDFCGHGAQQNLRRPNKPFFAAGTLGTSIGLRFELDDRSIDIVFRYLERETDAKAFSFCNVALMDGSAVIGWANGDEHLERVAAITRGGE